MSTMTENLAILEIIPGDENSFYNDLYRNTMILLNDARRERRRARHKDRLGCTMEAEYFRASARAMESLGRSLMQYCNLPYRPIIYTKKYAPVRCEPADVSRLYAG